MLSVRVVSTNQDQVGTVCDRVEAMLPVKWTRAQRRQADVMLTVQTACMNRDQAEGM